MPPRWRCPTRIPARCGSASAPAPRAAPTCTSSRATCRPAGCPSCPAIRSSASSTRPAPHATRFGRATASASPGFAPRAALPILRERPREPLRGLDVHRLDPRRRLRRVLLRAGGVRLRDPRRLRRCRGRAAPLRGHHRLPRARRSRVPRRRRGSASTASARPPTSRSRSRATGAARSTSSRANATHRRLALELGAEWAGAADAELPVAVDSAIVFAPAGELVRRAARPSTRAGTVALAGIHMSDVPAHELRAASLLGEDAPERDGEHAGGRRGAAARGGGHPDPPARAAAMRSPTRTARSPTWPETAWRAPPC